MPPFRSFLMLRSAYLLESIGRAIFPGFAGVYIVEAGKQIYAARGKAAHSKSRARRALVRDAVGALGRRKLPPAAGK
jgi:hypothetical protein